MKKKQQQTDIYKKKKWGQHFLRESRYIISMLDAVTLTAKSSVLEIGCGDGFLTRHILHNTPIERLWVYEIDEEWIEHVQQYISDPRLTIFHQDFVTADLSQLEPHVPWTILANLPYNITFPILERFQRYRDYIAEGVIMIQEEVAQKIVKQRGKGYGFISLYFQWYFDWKLLDKIPPTAFEPPPKVFSRLLYFKPRKQVASIPEEERFWQFIVLLFKQPRRTIKNNLQQTDYPYERLSAEILAARAQELGMQGLLQLWDEIRAA